MNIWVSLKLDHPNSHGLSSFLSLNWLRGYVLGYHGSPHFETNSSIIKGSLEVKLPTIWTDEKQRWEESEKRREEKRRSKKRKSQKKEDPGARKGRKVAKHCVFPMICGFGGSKSRLAKAAGAEPAVQMRDEKLHAVVARSTFRSQKCTKHTRFGPLLEVGSLSAPSNCI